MSSINDEILDIKKELNHYKNEWGWKVAKLISKIPEGKIISYGDLADWTNEEYDLKIGARNVANVRREIYHLLRVEYSDFKLPLHRIIKKYDYLGRADKQPSRKDNEIKRRKEGSWKNNPKMFKPVI
jgi:alkylated DNA nucleotide flippase Atl1